MIATMLPKSLLKPANMSNWEQHYHHKRQVMVSGYVALNIWSHQRPRESRRQHEHHGSLPKAVLENQGTINICCWWRVRWQSNSTYDKNNTRGIRRKSSLPQRRQGNQAQAVALRREEDRTSFNRLSHRRPIDIEAGRSFTRGHQKTGHCHTTEHLLCTRRREKDTPTLP